MFEFVFFAKSGFEHHVAPRVEEPVAHFAVGFGGAFARRLVVAASGEQEEFVATDHDGMGEVEGLIDFARGDVDDVGAQCQLFVGEAGVFAPENERGGVVCGRVEDEGGNFAGQARVVAVHAGAGAGACHNRTVGDGFFQGLENFSGIQKLIGMAGEPPSLFPVMSVVWVNNGEIGDSHVHHGSADGADVAGALGFNEDNSNMFEWIHK